MLDEQIINPFCSFSVQVVQVKPQLEQLLKLPEESLTKETRAFGTWRSAHTPSDYSTVRTKKTWEKTPEPLRTRKLMKIAQLQQVKYPVSTCDLSGDQIDTGFDGALCLQDE